MSSTNLPALSVPSLQDIILRKIVKDQKSNVLEILCEEYGEEWVIDFLRTLDQKDLRDLLADENWYDSVDFCKRIKSTDFTKISYEVFALSIKYYDIGILKKRLLMTGKRLPPSIVYAIHCNMTPPVREMFLRDNYDISLNDLIRLSQGKVDYTALRTKALSQNRKSINERFPFLSENRLIDFSNKLSKCIPIKECKKENIDVNIDGSKHISTLYAVTMRDHRDNEAYSIPYDYGYIFIVFDGKYIEVFCKGFDSSFDLLHKETFLCNTRSKFIDGDTETEVFVYSNDDLDGPGELYIHDSTNLSKTFENLVSIEVQFNERHGYGDYDDYFMHPYDYDSD